MSGVIESATSSQLTAPCESAVVVVPNDATTFPASRALFVGGTGTLTVTMLDGTDCTFTGVGAGLVLPIRVTKVKATGTTATNIVRMF